eukprot:Skav218983  [mRNA]  locus=scaffold1532:442218:443067:- [translate_table: standard]
MESSLSLQYFHVADLTHLQDWAQLELIGRLFVEIIPCLRRSFEEIADLPPLSGDSLIRYPLALGSILWEWRPPALCQLGERLADPKDGQLFHERFLAAFPVQEEASLDELRRELHGLSQQWGC